MFRFLQEARDYFLLYYKEKCSFSYIMQFSESVDKKQATETGIIFNQLTKKKKKRNFSY